MILIALGANLPSAKGGPPDTLRAALVSLGARGITVERQSGFYESEAWPDPTDPPFINAVASVRTALPPLELLRVLKEIEAGFGRKDAPRNAPRPIDLDIIDYNGLVMRGDVLELPHPRMESRAFVVVPMAEVAPGWRHPLSGRTIEELRAALAPAKVTPLKSL